jgi:pimeloyl-ACP methyl ester carboxylesterase
MHFHIEDVGQGQALLFIHAGVADSRMWSGQMGLEGYRTVAFDQRGFGQTPWDPGDYSDTDDALAVLDELGIESAVIVGCSMGASTAMNLAIHHSQHVDGLVLVGAFPSGWEPEDGFDELPLEEEAMKAAEAGDFERLVEIEYQMFVVGHGRSAADVDPAHKELFLDMDRVPVRTEEERSQLQKGFQTRVNDHLDEIDVPTLVIVGAHDEAVLVKAAHYLAQKLEAGEPVVLDGAAHLPSMEVPDAFNDVLRAFLTSM